jgi:hypothetical protein
MGTGKRKYHSINVGLEEGDRQKLNEMASREGRTQTELARDAIRWYMDHKDTLDESARQSETAKAIKRMEDRMAGLIARTAIDVGTVYQVLWQRSDQKTRRAVFESARNLAIQRLRQNPKADEQPVKDEMTDEIRGG